MRSLLASLAAVVAIVLVPAAVASVWLGERVNDEQAYLDEIQPLADDPEVQAEVADAVSTRLVENALGARGTDEVAAQATAIVDKAVTKVMESDDFDTVWREVNKKAHTQVLKVLRSEDPSRGIVVLDLSPVMAKAASEMGPLGSVAENLDGPTISVNPGPTKVGAAQRGYQWLDGARIWLPVLTGLAVLIAVVVARRRGPILALLGLGSAITFGLAAPVVGFAGDRAMDGLRATDRELAEPIWDALSESLRHWFTVGLVIAVIVLVVGLVWSLVGVRIAQSRRTATAD